ncbi:MAG TPA: crotonase/enoyl-CoA hydratase family protein [Burkholderiales bacterium]|jgi:DSF synthase|nr:crotonase/enoyl-CoA hydratase family protein [Burkholderiales bacterium]
MSNMRDAVGLCLPYGKANSQYETEFEPATGTIWGYFNPRGTACYSLGLLKDILAHDQRLAANRGRVEIEGTTHEVNYYVTGSRVPRVFNLGGDLALFVLLIKARDRDALAHYARLCIDNMYPRTQNFFSPTLTKIALVQGDALGGGFECALASDVIVAEESAQLGFPEILFNLFPGMGAYSLLSRRIGMRAAEELILSGRILPAAKLHEMGVVDVLAKDGEGPTAVREWIARNARRRNGMQAAYRARKLVNPVTREELDAITEVWVDAAFRLQDRDLKMMGRIVRAQMRRTELGDVSDVTAEALAEERLAAAG